MTRARSLLAGAVVLLSAAVLAACGGKAPTVCSGSTCKNVAGSYGVTTTSTQGSCSFTPYTLPSTVEVQQSSGGSQLAVGILDQVNQQSLTLTGPLYAPTTSKATDYGSTSLTRRASRLASTGSTDQIDLQITFAASFTEDTKNNALVMSGSLQTMSVPSGTTTKMCTVSVSFSATVPTAG